MQQGQFYDTVVPLDYEWLIEHRVVGGDVTLIAGEGGVGKDIFGADLIARCTRGDVMPGETEPGPPGSVITIVPEDEASFTTVHRLSAANADLSKVLDLTYVKRGSIGAGGSTGTTFQIPDDLGILRQAIARLGDCRMVWISPIAVVSSIGLTNNKAVRTKIWEPLQAVAKDTGVAICVVGHTTKAGLIAGSKGLTDASRVTMLITKDPTNPDIRQVLNYKSNITPPDVPQIRYTLDGDGHGMHVRYVASVDDTGLFEAPATAGDEPRKGTGQAIVLGVLRDAGRPLSSTAITTETRLPNHTVRVFLRELQVAGLVGCPTRDCYEATGATGAVARGVVFANGRGAPIVTSWRPAR